MPQPPGTGTTHHCPGAKLGMYVRLGPCKIVRKCCRTHQLQCQEPLCKGWIYMKGDRCIKCKSRARADSKRANAAADEVQGWEAQELERERALASRMKGRNPLKAGRK